MPKGLKHSEAKLLLADTNVIFLIDEIYDMFPDSVQGFGMTGTFESPTLMISINEQQTLNISVLPAMVKTVDGKEIGVKYELRPQAFLL